MCEQDKRIDAVERLCKSLVTDWSDYDFTETLHMSEKRVPKLCFEPRVKIIFEQTFYRNLGTAEEFYRKLVIEFEGNRYLFKVKIPIVDNIVTSYRCNAYAIIDDKMTLIKSFQL